MRKILAFCSAVLLCGAVSAQSFDTGGLVVDPSTVTTFDMFNTAQTQFNTITARSAAMAGAMTSLGADASAMSINPAGLGMYRSNELTFTPMVAISRSKSDAVAFESNGKSRFGVGNFGIVVKVRESSTGVTAINMGFSYNRIADYNYRYSFKHNGIAGASSIADIYAGQLAGGGITSAMLKQSYNQQGDFLWERYDPTYWGAILGYKTGLVNDPEGAWGRDMVGSNAAVDNYTTVESKGSAGEWVWSLGMNFNSKFYFGFSLGAATINRERHIYYGEGYRYDSDPALNYRMDGFNYDQVARMKGTGINFKIGGIYRPTEDLRIGVAFHTPTYYTITYKYQGGMTSEVEAINNVDGYTLNSNNYIDPAFSELTTTLIDDGDYSWRYTTPMRLMVGVSYTIAKRVILSADYERDWYNTMRMKNSPYGALYKDYIKETFRGSNTLRVGAEWRVIPQVALRAGYGLWGGALKDKTAVYSSPVVYNTQYVSTGAGIAISKHFGIDVAYMYCKNRLTPMMTFYGYDSSVDFASPATNVQIAKHNVMLTMSIKF